MTNAIAAQTSKQLAAAGIGSSPVLGIEGMDDRDGVLPRIQLLQDKAVLLKNLQKKKIQAVAGQLLNTADENAPLDTVEFIPAYMTKFWDIYDVSGEKKKWIARTFIENDPKYADKRWTYQQKDGVKLKPEVYEVISVVVLVNGAPAIVNFKGGSKAAGKELYQKARDTARTEQKPLWAYKFVLSSKEVKGEQSDYYALAIAKGGEASEAEQNTAAQVYQGFANKAGAKLNAAAGVTDTGDEEAPF